MCGCGLKVQLSEILMVREGRARGNRKYGLRSPRHRKILPPMKSPSRKSTRHLCNNWHCLLTWDCYFFLKPKYKLIDCNSHLASNFSSLVLFFVNCDFFKNALKRLICIAREVRFVLSYERWLILSLEPYLLKFHCKFKVTEFFLETCPFNKY